MVWNETKEEKKSKFGETALSLNKASIRPTQTDQEFTETVPTALNSV